MTSPPRLLPTRKPDIWLRRTAGESALVDPDTGGVHLLNDTAVAIWDLCDGKTAPGEMIRAICDLCDMHPDVVAEDVHRILRDFAVAEIITYMPDGENVSA